MVPALVKLLRVASIVLCLIVIVSTLLFAVNRTSTASGHQREELGETTVVTQTASKSHENAFHKGVDEVAEEVTAPVSGLVSSSSEWANHGIRLVFALLVYGFGLGYLARAVRVRT